MNTQLIVLTNCSERKRGAAQAFHLAEIQDSLSEKAKRWCRHLGRWPGDRIPAIERYQGDHWTASLALVRKAERAGWDANLWVASAGYGLIPADAQIHAYAATFGGNHADSVGAGTSFTPKEAGKKWWSYLSRWLGPSPGAPRTLEALATLYPEAAWLVLMSPTYLDAVSTDLMAARALMTNPDRLVIVSGTPGPGSMELIPHWVPALEISRGELGGGCSSLNARLAGYLASKFAPDRWSSTLIQPQMNLWMASLPPLDRPARRSITDREALAFIRKRQREEATTSHSSLLRELRDQGLACEQKRFRGLFQSLKASK